MTPGAEALPWDAIVLAGGASRRMGVDKVTIDVGGTTMLERVLSAVAGARRLVVVGPRRDTSLDVLWCREEPAGGGPAAGLRAGLDHVGRDLVVVLAADQPFADHGVVAELLSATGTADGAVAVDASDRPQWLCSAWRADALRLLPLGPGISLHATLGALDWRPVRVDGPATFDCDTPQDLQQARELAQ
jgi:molybdopterin-guanine dinucleotide biosynthesis protein A